MHHIAQRRVVYRMVCGESMKSWLSRAVIFSSMCLSCCVAVLELCCVVLFCVSVLHYLRVLDIFSACSRSAGGEFGNLHAASVSVSGFEW